MEKFLYIDLNLLSSLFLILIFLYTKKEIYAKSIQSKQLYNLIVLEIMDSFAEIAFYFMSFATGKYVYILTEIVITINLIIPCLMCFYFSKFIYSFIFKGLFTNKKYIFLALVPCITNLLLILTNFKTHFLLEVHKTSFGYTKNIGFAAYLILLSSYLILNLYVVIKHRKKLSPAEFIIFIVYNFMPIIGALPQVLSNSKIPTVCSTNTIGLILILLFMHKKLARYDALTGFWTRYNFEDLLVFMENKNIEDFSIAAVDLKNLSKINKKYGFAKGNTVLAKMNKIFKNSIKTKNIISRYRPNEFIIIFFTKDMNSIKEDFNLVRKNFTKEFQKAFPNLDYYFYCESFNKNKYITYSNFLRSIEKNLIEKNDLYIKEDEEKYINAIS